MASVFPNEIDNIPLFIDIDESDSKFLFQFEDYMKKGDFKNANKVLQNIPNSKQKVVTATRLNQLRDCIIALEKFYKTQINPDLEQNQIQWKEKMSHHAFVGTYNQTIPYRVNNIVLYQYKLYIRTASDNVPGKIPTDESCWRILTLQGERGENLGGLGNDGAENPTTFYFDWIPNQTYAVNSIVSYENKWWIALKRNINSPPSETNNNWELLVKSLQPIYPFQPNQPTSQEEGEIWFQTF